MTELDSYLPMEVRWALAHDGQLTDRAHGAVLFADIAGSTQLTVALARKLGARRGAEELTRQIDHLFSTLIRQIHRYHGSVTGFSGDAITGWFEESSTLPGNGASTPAALRATAAALAIQAALSSDPERIIPTDTTFSLGVKVTLVAGAVRRFVIGNPTIQRLESLAGATVDRVALAQQQAKPGEVLVGREIVDQLAGQLAIKGWRQAPNGESFAVASQLTVPLAPSPWPALPPLPPTVAQPWLLPPVFQRLQAGQGDFLTELRSVVAFFLKFGGIAYDQDEAAGIKLAHYIAWVQTVLARFEGYLMHVTIGDKGSYFNAAFGALVAHEDDAERALAAAFALQRLPAELHFIQPVQIGIGQDLGFVGVYGSAERRAYGILGNEINLAARLMSLAQPGEILVTSRIAKATEQTYEFTLLEPVLVKGGSEPLTPALVRGKRVQPDRRQFDRTALPGLVGRQQEQSLLAQRLQALAMGESSCIIIEGEAGIGKSRLLEEMLNQAQTRHLPIYLGAGDAIEQWSVYAAWQPILRRLLRWDPDGLEGSDHARQTGQDQVLASLAAVDPTLASLAPLLNPILPLGFPETERTHSMTGQVRADNTQELLIRLLQTMTTGQAAVLVLEDAHWLDSASWALVWRVKQTLHPLCLVIVTRPLLNPPPAEYTALRMADDTHYLYLSALPLEQIDTLLCRRLGVDALPAAVTSLIQTKAEGHPFFSEELAYALRDAGFIQIVDHKCHLAPGVRNLHQVDLPSTIEGVITSRIDHLLPDQQLTIKVASVIGRIFAYQLLGTIYPTAIEKSALRADLATLVNLALTQLETPEPDLTYLFRHAITQEVAYTLLLFRQRQPLHQAIAQWYEATYGANLAPFYPLLAYHWRQAASEQVENDVITSKAITYLEKAGEQALDNYANAEAVRFFHDLIALERAYRASRPAAVLTTPEAEHTLHRAQWHARLAQAYYGIGDMTQCVQTVRLALNLFGRPMPEQPTALIRATLKQIVRQGLTRLGVGAILTKSVNDQERTVLREITRLYNLLSKALYHTNAPLPIIYSNVHNLNFSEQLGPSAELAIAYCNIGLTLDVVPLPRLAKAYCQRGLTVARATGERHDLVTALVANGLYAVNNGQWQLARDCLEEGKTLAEEIGDHRQWGDCVGILADSRLLAGDIAESLRLYRALATRAHRQNNRLQAGWCMRTAVVVALRQGDAAKAAAELEKSLHLLQEGRDLPTQIDAYGLLAVARLRLNEIPAALAAAETASKLITQASPPVVYPQYLGYAGVAELYLTLWERTRNQSGVELVTHASGNFAALARQACQNLRSYQRVFPIGRPQGWRYQGSYHWLAGKSAQAHSLWRKALAAATTLAIPYEQGMIHYTIARHLPLQDRTRSHHLQQASEHLAKLEATYELACIQAEVAKA